jgi:pimeloyl-ACP methyl ester carboxylesterase
MIPPCESHGVLGWSRRLVSRLALALALLLPTGCGTAWVYRDRLGLEAERTMSLATSRVPSPMTAAVLERQGLGSPVGIVGPKRVADALETSRAAYQDPDGLFALADLRARQARRAELFARASAPGLYLDAVEAASHYLAGIPSSAPRDDPVLGPREQEGRRLYNLAVAGFLRASAGTWMRLDEHWRQKLAATGIQLTVNDQSETWDPDYFDHFYFTSDYKVLGIIDPKHTDGLGVPLIAERRTPPFVMVEAPEGEEKFYPLRLQAYPATAILRVNRGDDGRSRIVSLELHDPMRTNQVAFDNGPRPLANDLTTPLSFYFTSLPLPRITQVGLLRPGELEKETGLYLLHPYERGKIPVLLIHGLWSSPDTWHQALNELRGDPLLRERYQFWVYFYPTGDPFVYSATKLRQSLIDARQTLDPDRTDPAFDQMVLVGHSMGGLLSRLMVIDSETTFWDAIANRPFSELQADASQRDVISKAYFFQANPSIRRVVFVATPHRGSTMSGQLVGRLGNSLIRLPSKFEATRLSLLAQNGPDFFKQGLLTAPITSITQLSPSSAALEAVNARPLPPGLPYHSIIARAAPVPFESSTDLIVPYTSSHLDGAVSELVVDGNHSCLSKPEVIAEIHRILILHLQEGDRRPPSTPPAPAGVPEVIGVSSPLPSGYGVLDSDRR